MRRFLRTVFYQSLQLRNVLAMLCLGICICTYMQVLALEAGIAGRFATILETTGADILTINAGSISVLPNRGGGVVPAVSLSLEDFAFLQQGVAGVSSAVPVISGPTLLEFRELNTAAEVIGSTPEYVRLMNYQLRVGRFIDDSDNLTLHKVAVIGSTVAAALFSDAQERVVSVSAIPGRTIKLGNAPFEIVGVMEPKGGNQVGRDQDNLVIIPFATARRKVFNREFLDAVVLKVAPAADRQLISDTINSQLRLSHGLRESQESDFELLDPVAGLAMRDFVTALNSRLFLAFAFLTGFIATVGIVAVNYLNIRERQAEIGLRKAVGARNRSILGMIMLESLFSGLLGGLSGLLMGMIVFLLISILAGWPMEIVPEVLMKPFGVALLLTFAAAILPALHAARLQPVVALNRI
jgi:putative ABC transport system permease protein